MTSRCAFSHLPSCQCRAFSVLRSSGEDTTMMRFATAAQFDRAHVTRARAKCSRGLVACGLAVVHVSIARPLQSPMCGRRGAPVLKRWAQATPISCAITSARLRAGRARRIFPDFL